MAITQTGYEYIGKLLQTCEEPKTDTFSEIVQNLYGAVQENNRLSDEIKSVLFGIGDCEQCCNAPNTASIESILREVYSKAVETNQTLANILHRLRG